MAQHVFSGAGAPSNTPPALGVHYTDTTNNKTYISVHTNDNTGWQEVGAPAAGGGGGGTAGPLQKDTTMSYLHTAADEHQFTYNGTTPHNLVLLPDPNTALSAYNVAGRGTRILFSFPNMDLTVAHHFRIQIPYMDFVSNSTLGTIRAKFLFQDYVVVMATVYGPSPQSNVHQQVGLDAQGSAAIINLDYNGIGSTVGLNGFTLMADIRTLPYNSDNNGTSLDPIFVDLGYALAG